MNTHTLLKCNHAGSPIFITQKENSLATYLDACCPAAFDYPVPEMFLLPAVHKNEPHHLFHVVGFQRQRYMVIL
jgi:hypothetical protein